MFPLMNLSYITKFELAIDVSLKKLIINSPMFRIQIKNLPKCLSSINKETEIRIKKKKRKGTGCYLIT